jgi:membrane protease YdiL (CAAX protease family)
MRLTNTQRFFLFGSLFEAGLGLVALVLAQVFRISSAGQWQGGAAAAAWGTAAALPVFGYFLWSLRSRLPALVKIRRVMVDFLGPHLREMRVWQVLVLSVLAGWGEETLFRGVLQEGLRVWLGTVGACVAASLAFGAAHWLTRGYAVVTAIMGAYLGLLYEVHGGLLAPAVCHAVYDFAALLWLQKELRKPPLATGGG